MVATPIGNLSDLTPRAREVLSDVAVILAEDTRRSGLLCQRAGIPSPGFLSLHEHNEEARVKRVLGVLDSGRSAALVSDAGTPLLGDPGYRLVRAVREAGFDVSPVPGPFAPAAALSAAGLPPLPFAFLGFVPRSKGDLRRVLQPYAELPASLAFFERPSRLPQTLALAAGILGGEREACLARELTKQHEEFILGCLDELAAKAEDSAEALKGEVTVLVGPPVRGRAGSDEIERVLREEAERGGKPAKSPGVPRSDWRG